MSKESRRGIIQEVQYPIYATSFVGRHAVIVAGGGGAAKTGVPNRIDVLTVGRDPECPVPTAEVSGGLDTKTEAVMSLSVSDVGGSGAFFISLEGHNCVEYAAIPEAISEKPRRVPQPPDTSGPQSNSVGSSRTDAHSGRVVRQRRGSTKASDAGDSVNEVPAQSKADEPTQWTITKLRQFRIPDPEASSTRKRQPSNSSTSSAPSPNTTGIPTCVASGGPAGFWFAVGSDSGSTYLFDHSRILDDLAQPEGDVTSDNTMEPFLVLPDTSFGLSAGVCTLALTCTSIQSRTPTSDSASDPSNCCDTPLLATICEQPSWNSIHFWPVRTINKQPVPNTPLSDEPAGTPTHRHRRGRGNKHKTARNPVKKTATTDRQHFFPSDSNEDEVASAIQPYAIASYSRFPPGTVPPPSPRVAKRPQDSPTDRSNCRFKHCQFLKTHLDPLSTYGPSKGKAGNQRSYLLATTMQPLCANRKSVSRLILWQVPIPARSDQSHDSQGADSTPPLSLVSLTDVALPQGDLPACLAVHPSRSRALIAVGTMDGHVEVYFLSPRTYTLSCVYSLRNAHPIFVTALTFLPAQFDLTSVTDVVSTPDKLHQSSSAPHLGQSYELVSVSVDRTARWHSGPQASDVSRLARGLPLDPVGKWARSRCFLSNMLIYFGLVFLLPICLSLLDQLLYGRL